MQEVVSAPIFVLITGVAEVLIVIFGVIIFAYGVIIARNLSDLTKVAKKEVDSIARDLEEARDDIKNGVEMTKKRIGMLVGALSAQRALSFFVNGAAGAVKRKVRSRRASKSKKA